MTAAANHTERKPFAQRTDVLVWDEPGHSESRLFRLVFTLQDAATWLHGILAREGIFRPVIIGQSMGGYVGQMYLQLYPDELSGFMSIDSAPLQRAYMANWEIWSLKHIGPMSREIPWKLLKVWGPRGCATSAYGRDLMRQMTESYGKDECCRLSDHGFSMLAHATEADLPYRIDCPAMLVCGTKDQAGSAKSYNKRWAAQSGLPLHWIEGAGHNSNTGAPAEVNRLIEELLLCSR